MAGASSTEQSSEARKAAQAILTQYRRLAEKVPGEGPEKLFDYDCMDKAELLDAGPEGSVAFRFTITQRYANLNGVLHGGAAGVLFDMFTTIALGPIARPGYWDFMGGVTRALNISYLRAVPIGTVVVFRSRVVQHGRTMAMIRGQMTSEDGTLVYAVVEHHKVNVPTRPEHLEISMESEGRRMESAEVSKI